MNLQAEEKKMTKSVKMIKRKNVCRKINSQKEKKMCKMKSKQGGQI